MQWFPIASFGAAFLTFTSATFAQDSDVSLAEEKIDTALVGETEIDAEPATTENSSEKPDEPLNLAGFMASLFGEEPMSEKQMRKALKAASAYPLGSAENPVRADGPPGQREYLSRLRCADLSRPAFQRLGSAGMSPFGGVVDIYEVRCAGNENPASSIYMDMYHSGYRETQAVSGFGIVGGRSDLD